MGQSSSSHASAPQVAPDKPEPPINRLTDTELAKIFSYLDPLERLSTAKVCRKWEHASGLLWTDVTALKLAPIPEQEISSITRLCPNLKSVVASKQRVPLAALKHGSLRRLELLKVDLAVEEKLAANAAPSRWSCFRSRSTPEDKSISHDSFSTPNLEEAIYHGIGCAPRDANSVESAWRALLPATECVTLTKLHIADRFGMQLNAAQLFDALKHSPNIRCLTLGGTLYGGTFRKIIDGFEQILGGMKKLKELCFIDFLTDDQCHGDEPLGSAVFLFFFDLLQQLEVFIVALSGSTYHFRGILRSLAEWIELHPNLRLLVVAVNPRDAWLYGEPEEVRLLVPPRRRYPKGFDADPLPYLNVFIGGDIADFFRFSQSANARIWPISEQMPDFLAKPEIAEIAGGVWALDIVKNAGNGSVMDHFWWYEKTTRQSLNYVDDEP